MLCLIAFHYIKGALQKIAVCLSGIKTTAFMKDIIIIIITGCTAVNLRGNPTFL